MLQFPVVVVEIGGMPMEVVVGAGVMAGEVGDAFVTKKLARRK